MTRRIGSYRELMQYQTFEERFNYLRSILAKAQIGCQTFGIQRYLNQAFYGGREWKSFRGDIIVRDNGCDLGCPDRPIPEGMTVVIHHITPILPEDVTERRIDLVMDPENAITMSEYWHKLLHFGGDDPIQQLIPIERRPNDTIPWR